MLRTSNELIRYDVQATDGKIGAVKDLLFDDKTWRIRSFVVDTGGFLSHHNVLIDPERVRSLDFPEESLVLDVTKSEVQASPGLETAPPVSQQHLAHEHLPGQQLDRHLRSSNEVCEYTMAAKDSKMGKVHGLFIETATWTIRYLIVDTGEWLMGKLVLLGPHAVEQVDWSSQSIKANVTADVIRHSPAYDETAELSRDYEAFLHDYYGWPPYWE
jgi:sporulation protein YlmC with PRC-barrel domain